MSIYGLIAIIVIVGAPGVAIYFFYNSELQKLKRGAVAQVLRTRTTELQQRERKALTAGKGGEKGGD